MNSSKENSNESKKDEKEYKIYDIKNISKEPSNKKEEKPQNSSESEEKLTSKGKKDEKQEEIILRKVDISKLSKEALKQMKKTEIDNYQKLKPPKYSSYNMGYENVDEKDLSSYIISKKWIKSWKAFVNYPKHKRYNDWSLSSMNSKGSSEDNGDNNPYPGPITNEDILLKETSNILMTDDENDNTILRPELHERYHYKICNSKRAEYLYEIYGGKKIIRKKFKNDYYYSSYQTEIILHHYKIMLLPNREEFSLDSIIKNYIIYISRHKNITDLRDKIVQGLNKLPLNLSLISSKVRLWKFDNFFSENAEKEFLEFLIRNLPMIKKDYKNSSPSDSNIEINSGIDFKGTQLDLYKEKKISEMQISSGDLIVVERADTSGQFIFKYIKSAKIDRCECCSNYRPLTISCKCGKAFYCTQSCLKRDENFHSMRCTYFETSDEGLTKQTESLMGLTGLKNLGNSCYMNSGIQCISNCRELTNYFLKDFYVSEINLENPLGLKGNLAKSWARLIKKMYFGIQPVVEPSDFKKMIGQFNTIFSGYQQQDSHELISYILDGLHEDLNRIKKKPIVEQKEYTSTDNIHDVALECFNGFLLRNRSIIVDLFYGQFISTVVCPECNYVSIKADPYNSISLQIVGDESTLLQFHFIFFDTSLKNKIYSVPIKHVPKNSTIADLKEIIAKFLNVHKNSIIITLLSQATFDLIFCQEGFMKRAIKNKNNLYVFQIDQDIFEKYYRGYPLKDEKKEKEEKEKEEARRKEKMKQQSYGNSYNNMSSAYTYSGTNYYGTSYKKKNPDGPDNNHGLDKDCLRIILNMFQIESMRNYDRSWNRKERISYQRLIFIRRSMTLKELRLYIFKYFRGLFIKILEDKENAQCLKLKDENEIKIVKEGNNEDACAILNLVNSDEKKLIPYKIYLESNARLPYSNFYSERGKCKFCQKSGCAECELEFKDNKTVQDILNSLDPNKEIINDKFCYERGNLMQRDDKDLEINVVFNEKVQIPKYFCEFEDTTKTVSETKKAELNLEKLLNSFSIPDKLESGNEWFCPKCKKHLLATKKMEIYSTPPILAIHFKRFKSQGSLGSLPKKYEGLIDFPIKNLDMSQYTINSKGKESLYDLFAVSNHYGEIGVGHYTAYALNFENGSWHEFNDAHLNSIKENEIVTHAAYVLFYKRKELKLNDMADYEKIKNIVNNSIINSNENDLKDTVKKESSMKKSNKSTVEEEKEEKKEKIVKTSKENNVETNGNKKRSSPKRNGN